MAADMTRRGYWPWVAWTLAMTLVVVGGYLIWSTAGVDPGVDPMQPAQMWVQLLASTVAATAGAIILARYPRHVIGWLMLVLGLFTPTMQIAIGYAATCSVERECNLNFLISVDLLWFPALAIGLGGLFLLFPHGSLPRGWRRLHMIGLAVVSLVAMISAILGEEVYHLKDAVNPMAPGGTLSDAAVGIGEVAGSLMLLLVVAAIVDFVFRVRRSVGVERVQLRWLAWAGLLTVLGGVLSIIGQAAGLDLGWAWAIGLVAIPVAVTVAITRHGLYEIDRIISRTVTYAIVVGLLAGAVVLATTVISIQFESPLMVAATTLVVAAAFNPLRRRVQKWVDRRFNRSRYDAERVMDEFAGSLRDQTDASEVVSGWVVAVSETMQPSSMGVWVKR